MDVGGVAFLTGVANMTGRARDGAGGVEVIRSPLAKNAGVGGLCLIGVSKSRGRVGDEGSGSSSSGIAGCFREDVEAFRSMMGEDGGRKAAPALIDWLGAARAATGVASILSGVLAIWNAARSSRMSSRKLFLRSVAGTTELEEGTIS